MMIGLGTLLLIEREPQNLGECHARDSSATTALIELSKRKEATSRDV